LEGVGTGLKAKWLYGCMMIILVMAVLGLTYLELKNASLKRIVANQQDVIRMLQSTSDSLNTYPVGQGMPKDIQQGLTEEQVNQRLNTAWNQLKQSFGINQADYFQLGLHDLPEFSRGEGPIKDKNKVQSIITYAIEPNMNGKTHGSTVPLILIRKDATEVLIAYIEADGTNVLHKSILQDGTWIKDNEKSQKGTAAVE
jgi:hypothetical protein